MLSKITVEGTVYTASDEPLKLLSILRRHMDQTLDDCIQLSNQELFALKGWLVKHAEQMQPGKALWLEETTDGSTYRVIAAIGKSEDGSIIVWHEPLPWPFDFQNRSERID